MNILEREEQKYRMAAALSALIFAFAFIGLLSVIVMLLEDASGESPIGSILLGMGSSTNIYPFTIQNIMWFLFFLGASELWVRYNRATHETAQLRKNVLPENEADMLRAKDLAPIFNQMVEDKNSRCFFVQRLSQRVILQFQGSQSIGQAGSLLNSSLELMQHELDLKYNMLRYIVWLIPTIGFIGTVIGISQALSVAGVMPPVEDTAAIQGWVANITIKLAIAFNTTLVALVMSATLVYFLHLVQAREELALNGAGQYCLDNLINRLYVKV